MKHSYIYLFGALAILASCAKEVEKTEEPVVPAGKEQVTIIAQTPQTRTTATIGETDVDFSWQANETIAVVEQDATTSIPFTVSNQETGTFTGDKTTGKELLFAVSPAQDLTAATTASTVTNYTITLPATYENYVPGTTNAVMIGTQSGTASGDVYPFRFAHAAALVKVTYVNVPVGTKKLWFKADKNINGSFELSSTENVSLEIPTTGGKETWLVLESAVTKPNQTMDFYIPVPAGEYGRFDIALYKNAETNPIAGTHKKKSSSTTLGVGDVFVTPTVTLSEETITKGKEYILATSSTNKWSSFGTALEGNEMSWVPTKISGDGSASPGNYDSSRGQQFGTSSNGVKTVRFTGSGYDAFCASIAQGISTIDLEVGAKNDVVITGTVTVGGVALNPSSTGSNSYTAAGNTAGSISFSSESLLTGDVVIDLTLSSQGALYVKKITINKDTRTDPELAFNPNEYTVAAQGSFVAPTLSHAAGFEGEVTYSIGMNDDPDVASVTTAGVVTIGSKTGTVTVTATFDGDETYKPTTASYAILVVSPSLEVSATTPAKAECDANSAVTFTVTSNIAWTASTESDVVQSINPESGDKANSPTTVTVTLKANPGAERTATININPVSEVYAGLAKEVIVTQKLHTQNVVYDLYSGTITEGDYVIVYDGAAMKNIIESNRLSYDDQISISNDKITNPDASIVWHIAPISNTNYWYIYNSNIQKYAGSTGSKNQAALLSVVNDNAKWTVTGSETYEFENLARSTGSDSGNKWLRRNGSNGFACYATGTGAALSLYKINDGKSDAGVTLSYSGGGITYGDSPVQLALTKPDGLSVTCSSSKTGVATVTSEALVTITGAGTTTITASWDDQTIGSTTYRAGSVTYELTVAKKTPTIDAFDNPTTSVDKGGTVTNTTTISDNLTITYISSNEGVATVTSAGVVTGVENGTATISATFAGNDNYNAATSQSYTITVGTGGSGGGDDPNPVDKSYSFAFTTIGSTGWSNSYADHNNVHDDDYVSISLKSASKQTSNVTDYPVTKAGDVIVILKDGTMSVVTFTLAQWTTKAKTVSLQYSTDGGKTFSAMSPAVSSSNFTLSSSSLPTGTNAVKMVQGDTGNQVGLTGVSFTYTPSK